MCTSKAITFPKGKFRPRGLSSVAEIPTENKSFDIERATPLVLTILGVRNRRQTAQSSP